AVVRMLDPWPLRVSVLLRSADARLLDQKNRRLLSRGLNTLATACAKLSNHRWAEEILRLALQCSEQGTLLPEVFLNLGSVCLSCDRPGEALGYLRRAYGLGVARNEVGPLLAKAYAARGRYVAAMVCLEEPITAGARSTEVLALQSELDHK